MKKVLLQLLILLITPFFAAHTRWHTYTGIAVASAATTYGLWHWADTLDLKKDTATKQYLLTHNPLEKAKASRLHTHRDILYGTAVATCILTIVMLAFASAPKTQYQLNNTQPSSDQKPKQTQ